MKSTRRLLSIILCLVMCLSLLPASAYADDGIVSSGKANSAGTAEFVLYKSGKLVVSGTGEVSGMEHWSFSYGYLFKEDDIKATKSETKTLVIEQGITSVGGGAFSNCPNLTSVTLPSSLTSIAALAFWNCSGLKEISIPGNVTTIGAFAFAGCVGLTTVNLSTGLQTIGGYAFEDCTKLVSIMIPANVSDIQAGAFHDCGSLKTVTFQGSYVKDMIDSIAFEGVKADVSYPVDDNSWNQEFFAKGSSIAGYPDFGGRLTWKASAAPSHSDGWVVKNGTWDSTLKQWVGGDWYYYVGGKMLISSWKAFGGNWYYFGEDGKMLTGRRQIDGNYYYFGQGKPKDNYSLGARVSGLVSDPDDGIDYFYDENGVWQPAYMAVDDTGIDYMKNGWQQPNPPSGPWYFIRNQAKVTGWLLSNGYWYYLDPTTGAMVTGWLTWNGNTYYLRPKQKAIDDGIPNREGSMIAGCSSTIGDTIYTFNGSGALVGGKMDENPGGLANGFRNENKGSPSTPYWVFYRSDGSKAYGWELIDNNWYYFDGNGKMLTGWQNIGGAWYYLTKWAIKSGDESKSENWKEITDPTDSTTYPGFHAGRMVTGFNKVPYTKTGVNTVRTYYFKSSGALNGNGWVKVGLKWYFLEIDGVVRTGWLRDGSKWYYLDPTSSPIGEMVTGFVTKLADGTTDITDHDGNNNGGESFAASGEWIGSGNKAMATKAGAWQKHDGVWYYYNANGDDYPTNNNAVTGWQNLNGKWYYLDPSSTPKGKMFTGWHDIDGERYYFDGNGAALGGWQKIDGVWYYMYPNHDGGFGKMLTGWQSINGHWYFLNDDKTSSSYGALQDGWIKKKANGYDPKEYWFYLETDQSSSIYGAMFGGGWKQMNGHWYFFHDIGDGYLGRLYQGEWLDRDGKKYYFRDSINPAESWMVTGIQTIGGTIYYFGSDGALQSPNGWVKEGSKWYYFMGGTGMYNAWQHEGDKDYYLGADGVMATGWTTIGTDDYYFDPGDGHMWKNADKDGRHLGPNGKAV